LAGVRESAIDREGKRRICQSISLRSCLLRILQRELNSWNFPPEKERKREISRRRETGEKAPVSGFTALCASYRNMELGALCQ